jgi:TolB-like protein/DNA-binding winged helix-turn-helix (wHTH) protein
VAMSKREKQWYEFGPFRIDVAERLLLRDGQSVPLPPKAFDTLLVLAENRGHLLEKDELMERLWPDSFVEEANLPNTISLLRKALGDGNGEHRYIETVPRRGYRFIAGAGGQSDEPPEFIIEERISSTLTIEQEEDDGLAASDDSPAIAVALPAARTPKPLARPILLSAMVAFVAIALALLAYRFGSKPAGQAATKSTVGIAPASGNSIAVLPFKPLTADSRDESLELGMADTLITRLSNLRQIVVRPTSAVRKYNGLEQDPVAAGQELQVDSVLDGSIQRVGDKIRVTVRLVSVKDRSPLWAEKFDEKFTDIFAVQDSISERVVLALAVKLTGEERQRLAYHHTENAQAYEFYLKGRLFYRQWTEDSIEKALACYDKAIAIDPNYALAYAGKADLFSAYSSVILPPAEAMSKAREAAQKALQIDDRLAEARRSMARIRNWADWDWPGAEREFQRALEIRPNDAETHISYGGFLTARKRFDEALAALKRAQELDPLSFSTSHMAGRLFYSMRLYDRAIEQYREVVALFPDSAEAHRGLGCALREKGATEEAIGELQKAVEMSRRDSFLSELGYAYASAGRSHEAIRLVKELEDLAKRRYVSPVCVARIYVGLEADDLAFTWLDKAYKDRSDHLLKLGSDPSFDGVRSDARFRDLLLRVGLPQ